MKLDHLPDSTKFPRITRQEFCSNMDDILSIISKDNTAYVITEENKDDLILCPASWFEFQIDDQFNMMVICALRYAIGRATYMPAVIDGFVRRYMKALRTRTLHNMRKDIKEWLDRSNLDQRELWTSLYAEIGEEILNREMPEKNSIPDGESE